MDGKYLKKNKTVLTMSSLSMLATLARTEGSFVQSASGDEILELMNSLPPEIRVILEDSAVSPNSDKEEDFIDDSDNGSYKDVVVRVNGLVPKFAKAYIRNPIVKDRSGTELLPDFKSKADMDLKINGIDTVASLHRYSRVRGWIESTVGLKDLYTEVRPLGGQGDKKGGRASYVSDKKLALMGGFDVELVGNFKNCDVSVADVYMMNNNLRKVLTSGRLVAQLGAEATRDRIVNKATPDSPYAAIATYYGVINSDDSFEYDSFKMMTVEEFVIMLGKMTKSSMRKEDILKNANYCGYEPSKYMTRLKAIKLAAHNLGDKVYKIYSDLLKECEESSATGSLYFSDIDEGSEFDTPEVASYLAAGLLKTDEYGKANLTEGLNMSKAIRIAFSMLECAIKIDLDSTDYINVDEVAGA